MAHAFLAICLSFIIHNISHIFTYTYTKHIESKGSEYGISIFKLILLRYKCILRFLINVEILSNMFAITSNK